MTTGGRSRKCRARLAALGVLVLCLVTSCSPLLHARHRGDGRALAHLWATQTAQVPPTPDVQATAEALAHLWATQTAEAQPATAVRASDTPAPSATATPTPAPSPVPSPPAIEYLRANPATVTWDRCTNLEWGTATNATTVTIDQGVGGVATAPGSQQVCPAQTTTYVMTATGPAAQPPIR